MEKLDQGLKTLLASGKRRGFLTLEQVSDHLQEEASHPEQITHLLGSLEEMGIELVNGDEAEARLLESGDLDDDPADEDERSRKEEAEDELSPEDLDETSHRID